MKYLGLSRTDTFRMLGGRRRSLSKNHTRREQKGPLSGVQVLELDGGDDLDHLKSLS